MFVDAPEVARISLRQVTLTIDAAAAAALPEEQDTRRVVQSGLRGTLRRWFGR